MLIIFAHPREFGGREIWVQAKPGQLGDFGLVAGAAKLLAQFGGPTILPNKCPARRPQGLTVPKADGLALIGDTDRSDGQVGFREGLAAGGQGGRPDFTEVMFHLTIGRKVLREFRIPLGHDLAGG